MHHFFQAVLLFLAALVALTSVQAADMLFFVEGDCNNHQYDDWLYCTNFEPGFCCHAEAPFCGGVLCQNCIGDTFAVFQGTDSCPGLDQANDTCTPKSRLNCCLPGGASSKCAGSYYAPTSNNHDDGHCLSGPPSNTTCRHPDAMVYHDADGVKREIQNMTFETYKMSLALYHKGNIKGLNGTPV
ncbi:hypothetical protein VPNG_04942 [Cytospora leucostoma]|uniref:Uncharacterized protein n=1 Tax=Cytospora leucostoma TaxID=1230097 RepID=A0A423X7C9_9PEZI|nr:hypothetical protein VPNG_04942 [Cytospora leucostoma]